jgi:hypothetical protein
MLEIKLDRTDRTYAPGETMTATVQWSFDAPPKWLEIEFGWQTEGKGTSDHSIVDSEKWKPLDAAGTKEWKTTVPRGPLSLRGQLIRIKWTLTCSAPSSNDCSVNVEVTHLGQSVRLSPPIRSDEGVG